MDDSTIALNRSAFVLNDSAIDIDDSEMREDISMNSHHQSYT